MTRSYGKSLPDNFVSISQLEVCQEGGVKKGVTWRILGGSLQETWRTGSSLTPWMTLGDPKDHILKVSCHYLYFWRRYKDLLFW